MVKCFRRVSEREHLFYRKCSLGSINFETDDFSCRRKDAMSSALWSMSGNTADGYLHFGQNSGNCETADLLSAVIKSRK